VKLVVGLGNPGRRHAETRHNVGFRVVERLAARRGIELDQRRFQGRFGRGRFPRSDAPALDLGILEPQTWMNLSGASVAEAVRALPVLDPPDCLLVVLDDVDLPFGRLRVRPAGGSGGHRGLADVIEALGRDDFPRLRFGVGRPSEPVETSDWVLSPFSAEEAERLPERVEAAVEAVEAVLLDGVTAAMNRFNRDAAAPDPNP
jgi:PTH1 family peptidyl-tRNA hydrolase